ncbi:unnamed protein product [Amoebophrya sp. A120]|nr:unnamed protein product [Amoebophrya sp. A120]|eukprot:GSA120T00010189001.1
MTSTSPDPLPSSISEHQPNTKSAKTTTITLDLLQVQNVDLQVQEGTKVMFQTSWANQDGNESVSDAPILTSKVLDSLLTWRGRSFTYDNTVKENKDSKFVIWILFQPQVQYGGSDKAIAGSHICVIPLPISDIFGYTRKSITEDDSIIGKKLEKELTFYLPEPLADLLQDWSYDECLEQYEALRVVPGNATPTRGSVAAVGNNTNWILDPGSDRGTTATAGQTEPKIQIRVTLQRAANYVAPDILFAPGRLGSRSKEETTKGSQEHDLTRSASSRRKGDRRPDEKKSRRKTSRERHKINHGSMKTGFKDKRKASLTSSNPGLGDNLRYVDALHVTSSSSFPRRSRSTSPNDHVGWQVGRREHQARGFSPPLSEPPPRPEYLRQFSPGSLYGNRVSRGSFNSLKNENHAYSTTTAGFDNGIVTSNFEMLNQPPSPNSSPMNMLLGNNNNHVLNNRQHLRSKKPHYHHHHDIIAPPCNTPDMDFMDLNSRATGEIVVGAAEQVNDLQNFTSGAQGGVQEMLQQHQQNLMLQNNLNRNTTASNATTNNLGVRLNSVVQNMTVLLEEELQQHLEQVHSDMSNEKTKVQKFLQQIFNDIEKTQKLFSKEKKRLKLLQNKILLSTQGPSGFLLNALDESFAFGVDGQQGVYYNNPGIESVSSTSSEHLLTETGTSPDPSSELQLGQVEHQMAQQLSGVTRTTSGGKTVDAVGKSQLHHGITSSAAPVLNAGTSTATTIHTTALLQNHPEMKTTSTTTPSPATVTFAKMNTTSSNSPMVRDISIDSPESPVLRGKRAYSKGPMSTFHLNGVETTEELELDAEQSGVRVGNNGTGNNFSLQSGPAESGETTITDDVARTPIVTAELAPERGRGLTENLLWNMNTIPPNQFRNAGDAAGTGGMAQASKESNLSMHPFQNLRTDSPIPATRSNRSGGQQLDINTVLNLDNAGSSSSSNRNIIPQRQPSPMHTNNQNPAPSVLTPTATYHSTGSTMESNRIDKPSLEVLEEEHVVRAGPEKNRQVMDALDRIETPRSRRGEQLGYSTASNIFTGGYQSDSSMTNREQFESIGMLPLMQTGVSMKLEPLSETEEILLEREKKCQAIIARLELERDMLRWSLQKERTMSLRVADAAQMNPAVGGLTRSMNKPGGELLHYGLVQTAQLPGGSSQHHLPLNIHHSVSSPLNLLQRNQTNSKEILAGAGANSDENNAPSGAATAAGTNIAANVILPTISNQSSSSNVMKLEMLESEEMVKEQEKMKDLRRSLDGISAMQHTISGGSQSETESVVQQDKATMNKSSNLAGLGGHQRDDGVIDGVHGGGSFSAGVTGSSSSSSSNLVPGGSMSVQLRGGTGMEADRNYNAGTGGGVVSSSHEVGGDTTGNTATSTPANTTTTQSKLKLDRISEIEELLYEEYVQHGNEYAQQLEILKQEYKRKESILRQRWSKELIQEQNRISAQQAVAGTMNSMMPMNQLATNNSKSAGMMMNNSKLNLSSLDQGDLNLRSHMAVNLEQSSSSTSSFIPSSSSLAAVHPESSGAGLYGEEGSGTPPDSSSTANLGFSSMPASGETPPLPEEDGAGNNMHEGLQNEEDDSIAPVSNQVLRKTTLGRLGSKTMEDLEETFV